MISMTRRKFIISMIEEKKRKELCDKHDEGDIEITSMTEKG